MSAIREVNKVIRTIDDLHIARAEELEAIGDFRRADRVLLCNFTDPDSRPHYFCRQRVCPTCSQWEARRHMMTILPVIRRMKSPILVLATLPTRGLWDLRDAFADWKACLQRLRRRKVFKDVKSGCGALEAKLAEDGERWSLHAHLVLDIPWERFDLHALQRAWNKLTRGRGTFSIDHKPIVNREWTVGLARYITKADWISPEPGAVNPHLLELLWDGIRYQRLLVTWGPAWKKRKVKERRSGAIAVLSLDSPQSKPTTNTVRQAERPIQTGFPTLNDNLFANERTGL